MCEDTPFGQQKAARRLDSQNRASIKTAIELANEIILIKKQNKKLKIQADDRKQALDG